MDMRLGGIGSSAADEVGASFGIERYNFAVENGGIGEHRGQLAIDEAVIGRGSTMNVLIAGSQKEPHHLC